MRRIGAVLLVVSALLSSVSYAGATEVLYGSGYLGPAQGGDSSSTLYSIDPTTGAATSIGLIGFSQVGAIDFDPVNGMLYGIGKDPNNGNAYTLITIDPTTGAGTAVGALNATFSNTEYTNFSDISFRSDGTLFAHTGGNDLFTVDTATGAATAVGSTGPIAEGNAIAFLTTDVDTLYKVDNLAEYTLDQSNGTATTVTAMNYPDLSPGLFDGRANAMDFDPTGTLWASVVYDVFTEGDQPILAGIENFLATINLATGDVTLIGQTNTGMDALTVAPPSQPAVPSPLSTLWLALPLVGMFWIKRATAWSS